jgi:hypothetical protein
LNESDGIQLPGEALNTLPDSLFKNFITSILAHITNNIDQLARKSPSGAGKTEVTFFFIYRPLIQVKPLRLPPWPESPQAHGSCSLMSPWVQLTIDRSSNLTVQAVFIWNERQVLLDQALLAGADIPDLGSPKSITSHLFEEYVQDYVDTILLASSPEERALAQESIAKRIPADILWLFRHAWQSTFAPFSMEVHHALGLTLKRASPSHIALVEMLANRGIAQCRTGERYRTILDLRDIVDLSDYRIDNIH